MNIQKLRKRPKVNSATGMIDEIEEKAKKGKREKALEETKKVSKIISYYLKSYSRLSFNIA